MGLLTYQDRLSELTKLRVLTRWNLPASEACFRVDKLIYKPHKSDAQIAKKISEPIPLRYVASQGSNLARPTSSHDV